MSYKKLHLNFYIEQAFSLKAFHLQKYCASKAIKNNRLHEFLWSNHEFLLLDLSVFQMNLGVFNSDYDGDSRYNRNNESEKLTEKLSLLGLGKMSGA